MKENYLKDNPLEDVSFWQRVWRALTVPPVFTPGDDLSHWNTVNNWFLKQTEMKFSVLKLGEGGDPNPDENLWLFMADAKASGTLVMGYWFFRSNVSGSEQASHCLALLEQVTAFLGYKPVVWADVETQDGTNNANRLSRLGIFLTQIHAWNPGKVGIYSSPGFADRYLTPVPAWLNTYWHWIAHWTSAALPTQPQGWLVSQRKLWQIGYWDGYPWCLPVPGCNPDIDRNKFFGTEAELRTFTGAPPPLTLEQRVTALEAQAHTH